MIEVKLVIRKIVLFILAGIMTLNISGCGIKETEKKRYEASFLNLFDTATQVIGYAESKEDFTEYANFIYDNLEIYHKLYDIYNDYDGINNIKTINDNAGIKPVKVDQRIIDLLKFSISAYDLTEGKVNVAYGAVLGIWHDYREKGIDDPENAQLPPMDLLDEASSHTDINKVVIDEEASTIYLEDPDMSLDVGAIAKGYATEQVSHLAVQAGYVDGLLSVGGNVCSMGLKGTNREYWNVGIQNPDMNAEDSTLYNLSLTNQSMVTSGSYQRYYTVNGKEYHHIIDPQTLMPADYFTAVTIVCEDSGLADALSTAVYNMPYEDGKVFIDSLPDAQAIWVFHNGDIKYTEGFEKLISK